jgi:hypothetical protein
MNKTITYADQDIVKNYDEIADRFMQKIFKLFPEDLWISDESQLSDFSAGCAPEDTPESLSYQEFCEIGEKEMLRKIDAEYHLTVDPQARLIDVFEMIAKSQVKH